MRKVVFLLCFVACSFSALAASVKVHKKQGEQNLLKLDPTKSYTRGKFVSFDEKSIEIRQFGKKKKYPLSSLVRPASTKELYSGEVVVIGYEE